MDSPGIEPGLLDCQPNVMPLYYKPQKNINTMIIKLYHEIQQR